MKTLFLSTLMIFIFSTLFGQQENSFLLLNFPLHINRDEDNLYAYNVVNSSTATLQSKGINTFGIQWIKGCKTNKAVRLSILLFEKYFSRPISHFNNQDSIIDVKHEFFLLIPRLMFGKEFRKQLHESVSILGGMDVGVGVTKCRIEENTNQYYSNVNSSSTSVEFYGRAWAYALSIRPFTGIRISWGRLATGFEVSLPVDYSHVMGQGPLRVDGLKMNYHLNLGYRFTGNKHAD